MVYSYNIIKLQSILCYIYSVELTTFSFARFYFRRWNWPVKPHLKWLKFRSAVFVRNNFHYIHFFGSTTKVVVRRRYALMKKAAFSYKKNALRKRIRKKTSRLKNINIYILQICSKNPRKIFYFIFNFRKDRSASNFIKNRTLF